MIGIVNRDIQEIIKQTNATKLYVLLIHMSHTDLACVIQGILKTIRPISVKPAPLILQVPMESVIAIAGIPKTTQLDNAIN